MKKKYVRKDSVLLTKAEGAQLRDAVSKAAIKSGKSLSAFIEDKIGLNSNAFYNHVNATTGVTTESIKKYSDAGIVFFSQLKRGAPNQTWVHVKENVQTLREELKEERKRGIRQIRLRQQIEEKEEQAQALLEEAQTFRAELQELENLYFTAPTE